MGGLDEYCRAGGGRSGQYFKDLLQTLGWVLWEDDMTLKVGTWAPMEQSWRNGLEQLGPASCHHQGEDALHG